MFTIQRRERILDLVRSTGAVTVADLATRFSIGELTIRRDLTALADQGLITRVHGGATVRSELDTSTNLGPTPEQGRYRIGVMVPTLNYYWPAVVTGARAAAADLGVELVLRASSYDASDQRRQMQALVQSGTIHGLVAAPDDSTPDGAALLGWLDSLEIPVVLLERHVPSSMMLQNLESIRTDHAFGAGLAAHHLHDKGHQRIGLVLPNASPTSGALRDGWAQACAQLGLADDAVQTELTVIDGVPKVSDLVALVDACRETRTTALLVHSDRPAVRLAHYCLDNGIDVPRDLAIVAYDDEIAANSQPPVTAVRPPKAELGREAVSMLVNRLDRAGDPIVHRNVLLPRLIERSST